MTSTFLAITYHDPEGRLVPQITRSLPSLLAVFDGLAVSATRAASPEGLAQLHEAGARVRRNTPQEESGPPRIGRSRRQVVTLALEGGADWVLYCDADRALHWVESYPAELKQAAGAIQAFDFTVLGRTPRAFESHPRFQVDTERIINHVFGLVHGQAWDVTAGARGLSRRAAETLNRASNDDGLSTDVSWPLLLAGLDGFRLGYLEAEGLEYETADRYPDQLETLGGLEAFRQQLDADPVRWVHRVALALEEVQAVLPFVTSPGDGPLGPFDNQQD